MSTDRELLELAARAAGYEFFYYPAAIDGSYHEYLLVKQLRKRWNPLTDDGDALRLAVKLGFIVDCEFASAMENNKCGKDEDWHGGEIDDDDDPPYAATRRAIVRAAAEIGKAMP